jgi:hypothetical protein
MRHANISWSGEKTGKTLVMDLDLTLIHTFTDIRSITRLNVFNTKNKELRERIYVLSLHDVVDISGSGVFSMMWGTYRPEWNRFREFTRKYFSNVIIWSAGQPRYVDQITDILFPDPDYQPIVVYNYNQCVIEEDNIYKPLDLLYNDPRLKGICDPTNTLVIDDRDDTFSHNPENGILIPPFKVNATRESIMNNNDIALLQLEEWLCREEVANCSDVRTLNKEHIFSTRRRFVSRNRN